MNRDTDMDHVKSALTLREELAAGIKPRGVYGDAQGASAFTREEEIALDAEWRTVFAGPGLTAWTITTVE